jgi:hypothetical protein
MTQPPAKFPYWWYAGPALLAIASGALFIFLLFDGLSHTTDNLVRVVVPGSSDPFLQKCGDYTVFLEEQSSVGGKIYSTTQPITGLSCKLSAKDSHDEITFHHPGTSTNYAIGGRSGKSVLAFHIEKPGMYLFACGYGENKGPETVVAVGSGVAQRIFRTILLSMLSLFGGGGATIVLLALILNKHLKWQRTALANPAMPQ